MRNGGTVGGKERLDGEGAWGRTSRGHRSHHRRAAGSGSSKSGVRVARRVATSESCSTEPHWQRSACLKSLGSLGADPQIGHAGRNFGSRRGRGRGGMTAPPLELRRCCRSSTPPPASASNRRAAYRKGLRRCCRYRSVPESESSEALDSNIAPGGVKPVPAPAIPRATEAALIGRYRRLRSHPGNFNEARRPNAGINPRPGKRAGPWPVDASIWPGA